MESARRWSRQIWRNSVSSTFCCQPGLNAQDVSAIATRKSVWASCRCTASGLRALGTVFLAQCSWYLVSIPMTVRGPAKSPMRRATSNAVRSRVYLVLRRPGDHSKTTSFGGDTSTPKSVAKLWRACSCCGREAWPKRLKAIGIDDNRPRYRRVASSVSCSCLSSTRALAMAWMEQVRKLLPTSASSSLSFVPFGTSSGATSGWVRRPAWVPKPERESSSTAERC